MGGAWNLDPVTLMVTATLVTPLIAAADGFLWLQTRDRALLWWAGGAVAMAVGTLVVVTGSGRVAFTMLGGVSLILSHWLFLFGVRVLRGGGRVYMADRVLLAVLGGSYPLAVGLDANLFPPQAISAALAVLAGFCVHALAWRHEGQARASSHFAATVFALDVVLHVYSVAAALAAGPAAVNWLLVHAATFFLLVGWSFGFLMLIGQRNQERAAALADVDVLTGANTRRALLEKGQHLFVLGSRQGAGLGVLMLDIDHFKDVNDTYGHAAGDQVLRRFADAVRDCLRASDVFGRLGGEEFCVLLPDTGREGALLVAERIRAGFASQPAQAGGVHIRATVSIGVAVCEEGIDRLEALIAQADEALYQAKHQGRDRVVATSVADETAPTIKLVWGARYRSGHPLIDREHEYLFEWANALLGKLQTNADPQLLEADVREMLHWLTKHFRNEEVILGEMGWDGLERHARLHRALEQRGAELLAEVASGRRNHADLLDFVVLEVVARHLARHDTQYFPLVKTP